MRLAWPVDIDGQGNAYGYSTVSRELKSALTAAGITWDSGSATVLHVSPCHNFRPWDGVRNVWLTMWETDQIPAPQLALARQADLVLVPCRMNQVSLRWAGLRRPVRVVPFGVESAHLDTPVPDRPAGPPWSVLWVGAPTLRKGWDLLAPAITAAWRMGLDLRLVVKTTSAWGDRWSIDGCGGRARVIVEPMSTAELAALYREAHLFVLPTRGEGWGLTALEAMAAGCLVLAPRHGGLCEFFDETVGLELPWKRAIVDYGMRTMAPEVAPDALAAALGLAVDGYPRFAERRARATRRARRFTWTRAAEAVLAAITDEFGRAAA